MTLDQQLKVQEVRQQAFAKKLNKDHIISAKKVAKDKDVDVQTYLEEKGVDFGSVRYKDGTKKYTKPTSKIRRKFEEQYEETGGEFNTRKAKRIRKKYEKTATWQQSAEGQAKIKFTNPEKTRAEMLKYIDEEYKGSAKDFASEFKKKFGKEAEEMYKGLNNRFKKLFGRGMETQSLASQRNMIIKAMNDEVKKFNDRNKYGMGAYIPASSETNKAFVGKTLSGATSRAEVKAHQDFAEMLNRSLKIFNSQKAYLSAEQLKNNVFPNELIKDLFERKNKKFATLDEAGKKQALEKFLNEQLKKANNTVRKDTYLQPDKYKLTKLSGVYIEKNRIEKKTSRTVLSALGSVDRTVYNNLVKEAHSAQAKYNTELANQNRLRERLRILRMMNYKDSKTRVEIRKLSDALDDSNVKLKQLKYLVNTINSKKTTMEKTVVQQMKPQVTNNVVYNRTVNQPVTSQYSFRYASGANAGKPVSTTSADANQINRIVSDYIKKFNSQIDNMFKSSLAQQSATFKSMIKGVRDKLSNDFKTSIDLTKTTKKELKNLLDQYKGQKDKESKQMVEKLSDYIAKLDQTKVEMNNRFYNINVDLNHVKKL